MKARQLTQAETKAVVSRLFCLLKLKHCMAGKRTRIIDVKILIQSVFPQLSSSLKRIYPQILRKMAIPSEITVKKTIKTTQDEFPSSYLRTSLMPAKQKRSIRTTDYLKKLIIEIYLLAEAQSSNTLFVMKRNPMKIPKTTRYFMKNNPSLIAIAILFLQIMKIRIMTKSVRKLSDMRKTVEAPIQFNSLHKLKYTRLRSKDSSSKKNNFQNLPTY